MTLIDALEPPVDRIGVAEVLLALARVCNKKAEYVRHHWQYVGVDVREAALMHDIPEGERISR